MRPVYLMQLQCIVFNVFCRKGFLTAVLRESIINRQHRTKNTHKCTENMCECTEHTQTRRELVRMCGHHTHVRPL